MNILFIHSAADLYGSGKIMLFAIDALEESIQECHVCLPEDGPLVKELENRGCTVHIVELGILRRKYQNFTGMINRAFALIKAVQFVRKLVKEHHIEMIYSNTTAVLCGAFYTAIFKINHIWHIHEIVKSPKIFAKFIAKAIHKYSNVSIAVSNPVKDHWDELINLDIKASSIKVVFNGLPLEDFDVPKSTLREELSLGDEIIIGMVGRVHHWKGQTYFLDIAHELKKSFSNVVFVMVGDAFPGYEYLYKEIQEKKDKYSLNDVVFDLGFRSDVTSIMQDFDIFILPSTLPDPLPTVVLEAMGMKLPVVATCHGGALEMVVHGETGFHIPWNDAAMSAIQIEKLVNDKKMILDFGNSGRNRLETQFSIQAFKSNIKNVINEVTK